MLLDQFVERCAKRRAVGVAEFRSLCKQGIGCGDADGAQPIVEQRRGNASLHRRRQRSGTLGSGQPQQRLRRLARGIDALDHALVDLPAQKVECRRPHDRRCFRIVEEPQQALDVIGLP